VLVPYGFDQLSSHQRFRCQFHVSQV
jgi:hypothetical protein